MTSSIVVREQAEAGVRSQHLLSRVGTRETSDGGRLRGVTARVARGVEALDLAVCGTLRPLTLPALRILLGVLFVWFGALKVAGASPVEAMVSGTLPWLNPNVAVVGLGWFEVLLGVALVSGLLLHVVLPVLVAHLAGTFLTFVMLPELMVSDDNPLLLTEPGEFVVKNLVLISAAFVLMTHTGRARSSTEKS